MTATASVLKQEPNPEDLMQTIINEFDYCSMRPGGHKEKGTNVAFSARGTCNNWGRKKPSHNIKCFNCHKKGHAKQECWVKGGGKEGQNPRLKDRRLKGGEAKQKGRDGNKESANTAGDEEGVWMAVVNNSGDEKMANDKFGDFKISEDDLFFFKDDKRSYGSYSSL